MKLGAEDRKKLFAAGVAGIVLLFAAYYAYSAAFGGPATPPSQAPVIVDVTPKGMGGGSSDQPRPVAASAGGASTAVKAGTVRRTLDPTLHMASMLAAEALVYSGTGRNIFAAGPTAAEVAQIAKAQFDARPKPIPVVQQPANYGPAAPPVINLKFFGVATQDGKKRALLLSGEDVFLAFAGDVVDRRYKITTVTATSVTVQDLQNKNTQNLPLLAN